MKKFRVLSDLHIDYNHDYPIKIDKDGVFTVIAGDISGKQSMYVATPSRKSIKLNHSMDVSDVIGDGNEITIVYRKEAGKDLGTWTLNGEFFSTMHHGIRIYNYEKLKNGDKIRIRKSTPYSWIRENISQGIVIAGNHIVYNDLGKPIEELKEMYAKEFPLDSDITFLDNETGVMSKEVDGILFIGSTLYTNYELPANVLDGRGGEHHLCTDEIVERNMWAAVPKMSGGGMNDFNFGYTRNGKYKRSHFISDDEYCYLKPENYLEFFHKTFSSIKEIVENNPDKDIVIVTHHCPSKSCISGDYVNDKMNASYVSDLDDFIIAHPQIKCWVCGHVHHRASFRIGGCLCVMNPLGYCKHGQYREIGNNGNAWSPNVFVNTETWEVEMEPYANKDWDKAFDRYNKEMINHLGWFI